MTEIMKTTALFALFLLIGTAVLAQSLSGNLNSAEDKSILRYGNVDIYQEDVLIASVLTDAEGNFHVPLDTGVYRCVFNYAGHKSVEKKIHIDNDEVSEFSLEADPSRPRPSKGKRADLGWSAPEAESIDIVGGRGYFSSTRTEVYKNAGLYEAIPPVVDSRDIPVGGDGDFFGVYGGDGIPRSGALTAGEVNDFSKWEMWQDLKKEELANYAASWNIAPAGRYSLQLNTASGLPIVDAIVRLMQKAKGTLFTARTDNTGKAEMWLDTRGLEVESSDLYMEVEYMGLLETIRKVKPFSSALNYHTMELSCYEINTVDIAFVVDATGSMGDELMYLQAEMNDVIYKAKQISDKLDFHFANVFYRDMGDEYVTRTMNFSRVLSESVDFINAQSAGGGGDYEEAVEVALDTAIHSLAWSETARTRLLFLIMDAPPHNNSYNRTKMEQLMRDAANKGIRIVPVGASGINKATEYLLRTLAIGTNGTYTFLTNHSGIGNAHIEPSTDEYKVETFNDLMVRILKSYTYMPDCEQNIPDLNLEYPDSLVELTNVDSLALDSLLVGQADSLRIDSLRQNPPTITQLEWSYFPNPTTGVLNIKPGSDIDELFITDLSGKLLQSVKHLEKDRIIQVDLSAYTTGIYLIRYMHEDHWITGKVVLQRW